MTSRGCGPWGLAPRQVENLHLMCVEQLTSKEIAGELGLTMRTVENHRFRINARMGTRSCAGACFKYGQYCARQRPRGAPALRPEDV